MAQQGPVETIQRYLDDALAAERNFENQLRAFAKDAEQMEVRELFERHADETRRQQEMLEARLTALGGRPSGLKGFLAQLFSFAPRTAQLGHERAEKVTQDLITAYAVEQSEVAMYEALACAAAEAGDSETEALARRIQQEEKATADRIWQLLPQVARDSFRRVTAGAERRAA